jgi:hypothetical protein
VWGAFGMSQGFGWANSDGVVVRAISSLLEAEGRISGAPVALRANLGIAFQGTTALGAGFTVSKLEAEGMIRLRPANRDVLRPYMNGEDLNSRPDASPSRYIIDFRDWELEAAQTYKEPFGIVEERVKPERLRQKDAVARRYWWRFSRRRNELYRKIESLSQVLAITIVSKTVMPLAVRSDTVFGNTLAIFATDDFAELALLSSMPHRTWAIKYGSGMRNDPRYTPSDVFETYPRPQPTQLMSRLGQVLDRDRREIMLRRGMGLTALYNLVSDPSVRTDADVGRVREIHVDIDKAVLEAYDWTDIPLDHGFFTYRQMERFTVSPAARVEILDRLLEENHRRAALEAESGSKATSVQELDLDPEMAPEGAMF